MSTIDRKKMSTLYILEILRKYTDDETDNDGKLLNTLTQAQIKEKLEHDFELTLDRKAIKRGLFDLTESTLFGDMIGFDTVNRNSNIGGEESEVRTNFYLRQMFNAGQTKLLTDAVMYYRGISESEARELIEIIGQHSNLRSRQKLGKSIVKLPQISKDKEVNDQLLYNIDILDDAIEHKKQVGFIFNYYGKDKKLHPKLDPYEKPEVKIVNPYRIVPSDGKYFLVCNYDDLDTVSCIRIDQITDMEILDNKVKPKEKVEDLSARNETLAEQLYFSSGKVDYVEFRLSNTESLISDAVDWFGNSINFYDDDGKTVRCRVKTNLKSMRFWAMQYSDHVEIIRPQSLRDDVLTALRNAWGKYNNGKDIQHQAEDEIDMLISDWKKICKSVENPKDENSNIDISELGKVVRKTNSLFLPYFDKEPAGKICELITSLRARQKECFGEGNPDRSCVGHIIYTLLDRVYPFRNYRNYDSETLYIGLKTREDGFLKVKIDLDNFEEDYLTLRQYKNENAKEHKIAMAEMRERIRAHREKRLEELKSIRAENQTPQTRENRKKKPLSAGNSDIK